MKNFDMHAEATEWSKYAHEFFTKHKLDNSQIVSCLGASLIVYLLEAGFDERNLKTFIQDLLKRCVETKRNREMKGESD